MADLNGDGRRDMFSGSWPGEIYWFAGEDGGKFAGSKVLTARESKALHVGKASAVAVHDWDSDGDADLLIGNIEGQVFLARNAGTAKEPAFEAPLALQAVGKDIRVGGDAGPCVADWDGDGVLDLIVGDGDRAVTWYRNEGTSQAPTLASGQVLVVPHEPVSRGAESHYRAKVCVTDWNQDGRVDLLLGDAARIPGRKDTTGFVWLYLRAPATAPTSTAAKN